VLPPPPAPTPPDCMATYGAPLPAAKAPLELATSDGNVLVFNAHVSAKPARPVEFPAGEDGLPDNFSRLLLRMSSPLPPKVLEAARADGFPVGLGARGFVFNADLVSVVRFLDIGTRVAHNLR